MHNSATHSTTTTPLAQLSVLVIDDDRVQRQIMAFYLQHLGVREQREADGGQNALTLLASQDAPEIDVVICDLDMPDMDGMECLRRLAEVGCNASVVLYSASDANILRAVKSMARAHGLTVLGVLQKPTRCDEVLTLLSQHRRATPTGRPDVRAEITEADLRRGIAANELIAYYQPKVNLRTGVVRGLEALARWQHPQHGIVSPDRFLPLAEAGGLMGEVTKHIADGAIEALASWRKQGFDLNLSINLSLSALDNPYLATEIPALLPQLGLSTKHITLEITESMAVADNPRLLETLSRLRLRGYGLSIDDFGTGFSSFKQLTSIPFTELKIDRHFVNGVSQSTQRAAIVESTVALAQSMGLSVVAEGVESVDDWGFVGRAHVTEAQGALISMPIAGENIPAWIVKWRAPRLQT